MTSSPTGWHSIESYPTYTGSSRPSHGWYLILTKDGLEVYAEHYLHSWWIDLDGHTHTAPTHWRAPSVEEATRIRDAHEKPRRAAVQAILSRCPDCGAPKGAADTIAALRKVLSMVDWHARPGSPHVCSPDLIDWRVWAETVAKAARRVLDDTAGAAP